MKVRFFTADSIQEAMAQVKNVLGRDAIILHTRTFRKGGILGFFAKEKVEVMAGIDTPVAPIARREIQPSVEVKPIVNIPIPKIIEEKIEPIPVSVPVSAPIVERDPVIENEKFIAVQLELANMSKLLEQLLSNDSSKGEISSLLKLLIKNDIDIHIAEQIIEKLPAEYRNDKFVSAELKELMIKQIKEKLKNIEGIKVPEVGRKVVAFIGSTGVGKTTTIAKIAANFAIQAGYSVALITADTYRVSAVEQLKTYSDIMGIPIHVVYTADELKKVLDANLDKQLILIDTAGRSPHNNEQLEELNKLLQIDASIEKHLVLSTTTKYKDALDIVEKFSICSPNKVIFTKLDEAHNIGTIINLLYQMSIPLSYVTNGQNVPDDIELVDPQKLVQLIFRDS